MVALKAALAVVLALSIARAFLGPAPAQAPRRLALLPAIASVALYLAACLVVLGHHATGASLLAFAGVEASCLAAWLARGRDDGLREGDEPEPDPPVDWATFDRERERWGGPGSRPRPRERPPEPVG